MRISSCKNSQTLFCTLNLLEISSLLLMRPILCVNNFPNPPKVWLKSFIQTDDIELKRVEPGFQTMDKFKNDFVSKNGSIFSFWSNVKKAYFVCEAEYPIQWNTPLPKQFTFWDISFEMFGERKSHFNKSMREPINQMFYSYLDLNFYPSTFVSGNFTCEPIQSESNREQKLGDNSSTVTGSVSGVYVFSESEKAVQAQGKTLCVNLTKESKTAVLPCRPALPEMQLSIFKRKMNKKSDDPNEWIKLTINDSISFDPTIGYTFITRDMPDVLGEYKCELAEDNQAFVLVRVKRTDKIRGNLMSFDLKQNFSDEKAKIITRKTYMQCCNGLNGKEMFYDHFDCTNQHHCDILKAVWKHEYMTVSDSGLRITVPVTVNRDGCIPIETFDASVVVICQSDMLDVAAQFVPVYDDEEEVANRSKLESSFASIWINNDQKHLYDISKAKEPTLKKRITFRLASPLKSVDYGGSRKFASTVAYVLHNPTWDRFYDRDSQESVRDVTYLTLRSWDIFEGEEIAFICYSLRFYYARGGWLRLNWKNGTRTMLQGRPKKFSIPNRIGTANSEEKEVRYMGHSKERDNTVISSVIKISLNMSSVECHVPRLATSKWDWREFILNVQQPMSPKFVDDMDETVTFKICGNDIGFGCKLKQQINCSLLEGQPTPKLTWEKDGKVINSSIYIDNEELSGNPHTLRLIFRSFSQEMTGSYKCIAENLGGKAEKTFTVRVEDLTYVSGNSQTSHPFSMLTVLIVGAALISIIILLIIIMIAMKVKTK